MEKKLLSENLFKNFSGVLPVLIRFESCLGLVGKIRSRKSSNNLNTPTAFKPTLTLVQTGELKLQTVNCAGREEGGGVHL